MIERLSGFAFLGGTSVLCLLFALAVWVIAKTNERRAFFRARNDDIDRLANELVDRLRHSDVRGADRVLGRSPSIEAALVRPALDWIEGGPEAVESFLNAQRAGHRRAHERILWPIETIARHTTWFGLFGSLLAGAATLRHLAFEPGKDLPGALLYGASFALFPAAVGVIVGLSTKIAHEHLAFDMAQIDTHFSILSSRVIAVLHFKKRVAEEFGVAPRGTNDDRKEAMGTAESEPRRPLSIAELD